MLGIALSACKKIKNHNSWNEEKLEKFFSKNAADLEQRFEIPANTSKTIVGAKGTKVSFEANSFVTSQGYLVTGTVQIKLIEVFSKSDMLLVNKPTMGKTSTDQRIKPLISGGEVFVQAYQDDQPLYLAHSKSYQISVPYQTVNSQMEIFEWEEIPSGIESTGIAIWNMLDSSDVLAQNNMYTATFNSFHWVNYDYFANVTGPTTPVRLRITNGLNDKTCKLFYSVDGQNTLGQFFNYSNGIYSTSPDFEMPIGMDIHVIALSFKNNKPYFEVISVKVTDNTPINIGHLYPTSAASIKNTIDNLP